MNKKICLALGLILIVLAAAVPVAIHFSIPEISSPADVEPLRQKDSSSDAPVTAEKTKRSSPLRSPPVTEVSPDQAMSQEQWEAGAEASVIETLFDWGSETEPEYMDRIIAYFDHEEAEVRKAAVEAVIQFGSRDAIPALREQAEKISDLREKLLFQEAAEYLELPTRTELRAQGLLPSRRTKFSRLPQ